MSEKNPHQIIGTFCDKCRNVMCTCNYKENKAPNKICVDNYDLRIIAESEWKHDCSIWKEKPNECFTTYILESEHLRVVEELNGRIELYQKQIEQMYNDFKAALGRIPQQNIIK